MEMDEIQIELQKWETDAEKWMRQRAALEIMMKEQPAAALAFAEAVQSYFQQSQQKQLWVNIMLSTIFLLLGIIGAIYAQNWLEQLGWL